MSLQSNAKEHPLVSVCIANYNGEKLLDACIASVQAQQFDGSIEILVHDDASTDASLEVLTSRHPDVLVIASDRNVGYCCSNNRMAARASGVYLLLLNNDAELRPDAIQTLVKAADRACEPLVLSLPQYDRESGRLVDFGVRLDLLHTPVANRSMPPRRLAYVQAACMFVRRETWAALGGFPEWMGSNAEDLYFCAQIRLRGGLVQVAADSGYDHRQGVSFGGNRLREGPLQTTYRRRYLSERNRAAVVLVCTPTPAAWAFFCVHLMLLLIEGGLLSMIKFDAKVWTLIYWPAVRDAVHKLTVLRDARRTTQATRTVGFWTYVRVLDPVPHKLLLLFRHGLPRFR